MPGTHQEIVTFARQLLDGELMPDTVPTWADGSRMSQDEAQTVLALMRHEGTLREYARRQAESRPARRKAYRLLRRFLGAEQLAQLNQGRCFYAIGPSGRQYRFLPATGVVEEVEQHGKHRFGVKRFCLHPDNEHQIPAPDITLAQLLLISSDEEQFLAKANVTDCRSQFLWNGEWQRRLNQSRREREAHPEGVVPVNLSPEMRACLEAEGIEFLCE